MAFTYRYKPTGRETRVLEPKEFAKESLDSGAGEDYASKLADQRRHVIELMDESDVWERVTDDDKPKRTPAKKTADSTNA